jgi:arylsulfatase A-like enzyme
MPGYSWFEEMDNSLKVFADPLTSGYKQTIDGKKNKCMWTPFIIMGPGIKKGYEMKEPIELIDQMPTILKLMDIKIPDYVQGKVLNEILE